MKKSRVPKEELLAFQEACRKNGLPDPDFDRRRTKNIVVNDVEGKPICQITPEGEMVQPEESVESGKKVAIAGSDGKKLGLIVTVEGRDDCIYFYPAAEKTKFPLSDLKNISAVQKRRAHGLDHTKVNNPVLGYKDNGIKRKSSSAAFRKKKKKIVEY